MSSAGLQDAFLNALRKSSSPATFFLVNGVQMKAVLRAFDEYTLLLESGGQQKLLFKHALSTLIPEKRLDLHA
ncbi:MAG: RNA chaperone Hfq [Bacillota bacterium]|nr:RNA chaperone Hfq [Bacillota bacterium]